ncbi:cell wall-binding repeat-containing protein [Herbiconiux daphne]|uniref:Cell wall-binding repeat-containing protein n=1 Tax=Herbiconiux daphne TaxID=2970914 RepID=A0ABT2H169_9MICO|nr:cell wall-binding repeat-containing protein [Herbiconiux daphne]MCS5733693.1 cell wall-binding repeat-containing protein [Herbiconiux daphne]
MSQPKLFRSNVASIATAVGLTLSILLAAGATAADAAPPAGGETQLVSVSRASTGADANAQDASISADGRYVAFSSAATNLASTVTNGRKQIFVRDLESGTTTLITQNMGVAGDGDSTSPSISADGSVVAYLSSAKNLAGSARTGFQQALVWSRATNSSVLASATSDVVPGSANADVGEVTLSDDGSTVAFSTTANNLTTDANPTGWREIFVRVLASGITTLASFGSSGPADDTSGHPALSGDGHVVVFSSAATLADVWSNGSDQIYRRDLAANSIQMISKNRSKAAGGGGSSLNADVSSDGNVVVFFSAAFDLTDTPTVSHGIYWHDVRDGLTRIGCPDYVTGGIAIGGYNSPSISSDGSSITFLSSAKRLTREGAGDGVVLQAYVNDLKTGVIRLASRSTGFSDDAEDAVSQPSVSGNGRMVAFSSRATNLVPGAGPFSQVYVRSMNEDPGVERVGGTDRFAVSAGVSGGTFGANVPVTYVASGETFADALSGSAAAGAKHAPVLLVTRNSIPGPVSDELRRLTPKKIVVLGGVNTIDPSVERALAAFSPSVTRISGADRFALSAAVSAATFGEAGASVPIAYVASGAVFPDALSGSAAAGYLGGPVLLATKEGVSTRVFAELGRLRPASIVVLGGVNTLSDSVVETLSSIAPTSRIAGADRFAVSAGISAATFPTGTIAAYVASGAVFPDALSGSAAAIRRGGPVLLVTADRIPDPIKAELARLKPTRIIVLGGTATVSEAVLNDLKTYAVPIS